MLHRQVLERHAIQGQLQIAHQVQARLLPGQDPDVEGYDISGLSLPAFDIGGDYYDYIPLPGGRLGLVVADVAGKGIPAALIMSTFRALLRTSARRNQSVARTVQEVNVSLAESIGLPAFVTSVYGVLEPATGRFTFANCGHNAPLIVRSDGSVEQLPSSGPFLGVFEGRRTSNATPSSSPAMCWSCTPMGSSNSKARPARSSASRAWRRSSTRRAASRPPT